MPEPGVNATKAEFLQKNLLSLLDQLCNYCTNMPSIISDNSD